MPANVLAKKAQERKEAILGVIMSYVLKEDAKGRKQADAIASKAKGVREANQLARRLRSLQCDLLSSRPGADLAGHLLEES